jgi:hypothetical protein
MVMVRVAIIITVECRNSDKIVFVQIIVVFIIIVNVVMIFSGLYNHAWSTLERSSHERGVERFSHGWEDNVSDGSSEDDVRASADHVVSETRAGGLLGLLLRHVRHCDESEKGVQRRL